MYTANEALILWFDNDEYSQIVLNQAALDCSDYDQYQEWVEEYYGIYDILDDINSDVIREFFMRGWREIDWWNLYEDMRYNATALGFTAINEEYEDEGIEV